MTRPSNPQMVAESARRRPAGTRYMPGMRLLHLAMLLSGSHSGVSLDEMAKHLDIGRRSAERLRNRLDEVFRDLLTYEDDSKRIRRWRLPSGRMAFIPPKPGAIATLEALARDLAAKGDSARAADLRDAAATIRSLMRPEILRRAEPDIEALMQAEGSAAHPGPRLKLDPALMGDIRTAILGFRKISLTYRPVGAGRAGKRTLCPYGVLHGRRAYLVAHADEATAIRLWRIDRISNLKVLDQNFLPQAFDLAAYASRSFGVFQEEPLDIVLRFSPEAAEEAADWLFHPSQVVEPQPDGSLVVRLRCGGTLELCWHLFMWGDMVRIVEPASLRDAMRAAVSAALRDPVDPRAQTHKVLVANGPL